MNSAVAALSTKSHWLIAFAVVGVAELALVALRQPAAIIATWLLAPVLAVWVWRARGPNLLILAVACCWVGDVLGNPRSIGIGPVGLYVAVAFYALADVLFIIVFLRGALRGAVAGRQHRLDQGGRWRASIGVVYLVAAALGLALTWGALAPPLRVVAGLYLLLLAVMATTALVLSVWAGVGAALLFATQFLAVLEIGGRLDGTATSFRLPVLALYIVGIVLIAIGVVGRELVRRREVASEVASGGASGGA
jgi:hypothetical protein